MSSKQPFIVFITIACLLFMGYISFRLHRRINHHAFWRSDSVMDSATTDIYFLIATTLCIFAILWNNSSLVRKEAAIPYGVLIPVAIMWPVYAGISMIFKAAKRRYRANEGDLG